MCEYFTVRRQRGGEGVKNEIIEAAALPIELNLLILLIRNAGRLFL